MYLDDKLLNTDHLCCMAHARAKFQYAFEQGDDADTGYILELMKKALRYLDTFWKQLIGYLNDGRYSIDTSIAERFIRLLAGELKNSLFFGSNRMAEVSAAYHTIISICRMHGISVLEFFKKFFGAIVSGRRDYENL